MGDEFNRRGGILALDYPRTAGKRQKQLSKGVSVSVYESKSGWVRIHPTQQPWVASRDIRPD